MPIGSTNTIALDNLKMPGFLSVGTYGAKGDDVTDDRAAIAAAFAAANLFGGVDVYFPDGKYIVPRQGANAFSLTIPGDNLRLRGPSRGRAWLKQPANVAGAVNTGVAILEINGRKGITISNMGFDGGWGNGSTYVAQSSAGQALPGSGGPSTINVLDTSELPSSGTFTVVNTDCVGQVITYTSKTTTAFLNCTGGTGTIQRGGDVVYVNANTGINQFTQSDPKSYGVFCRGSENIIIENCEFRQIYGDCMWFGTGSTNTKFTRNVRVLNCNGYMAARNGITLGSAVIGLVAENCHFTAIYAQAFDAEPQNYPVADIVINNCLLGRWPDPSHFPSIGCGPLSIVGGDINGFATYGAAARNWRVTNCTILGTVFVQYAQDVVFANNNVCVDCSTGARGGIQVMLGSGDVSILNNWFYCRASNAGVSDAGKGCITIFNYAFNGGFFNPSNAHVRGNKLHVTNGKYGINIVAPGGTVTTATGVATAVTSSTLTMTGAGWAVNQFLGCVVRCGTSMAAILSNTTEALALGLVDNSFGSAWQTFAGNYANTPADGAAFEIYRPCGVVDVDGNDIDMGDDGNGNGSYGVYLTQTDSTLPGMRVRVTRNTIKNADTSGIFVLWAAGSQMQLVDISNNFGLNDRPSPTMTSLITYSGVPNVLKWIMGGNSAGPGVTSIVSGLSSGQWLLRDGDVPSWAGYGGPEGAVTAPVGATYQRVDGAAGTTFYVKEGVPTPSTGWAAK